MSFNAEQMVIAVGEVVSLTLDIDPQGQPVNGVMAHLSFDPDVVEVLDVTLTDHLPLVLAKTLIDNQKGEVSFAAGILGQTITEEFSVAALALKLKAGTLGTSITPADIFTTTDVRGPQGSVLAEATGTSLKTETSSVYLPIVMR